MMQGRRKPKAGGSLFAELQPVLAIFWLWIWFFRPFFYMSIFLVTACILFFLPKIFLGNGIHPFTFALN